MLHGVVYPPAGLEEGRTYPTILYVYGGPQIQVGVVTEFRHGNRLIFHRWSRLVSVDSYHGYRYGVTMVMPSSCLTIEVLLIEELHLLLI